MSGIAEGPTSTSEEVRPSALSGVAPLPGAEASNLFPVPLVKVGLYRTEDHDYYVDGQGPYPSVTSILRVMHKPAIEAHLKLEVGKAAVAAHLSGELADWIVNGGDSEAARLLAGRATLARDAAATLGTNVHAAVESVSAPESLSDGPGAFPVPEGALPYLEAFQTFLSRSVGLQIVSSEKAIFNLTEGYAGTYDFLARWQGAPCKEPHDSCLWLVDVKSGKDTYPDHALQLEAYRRGEFISLSGDPFRYPMPWADHVAILHLRPDKYPDTGYRLIEYVTGDRDWIAFLAALNLYQWQSEKRFLVREGRIRKHT